MTVSQVQAVVNCVKDLAIQLGLEFTEKQTDAKTFVKEEDISLIAELITAGMCSGEIQLRDGYGGGDRDKIAKYAKSLIKDQLNKSKRLNGGNEYVPKNPGSRAGQGDETVKELRKAIKFLTERGDTKGVEECKEALTKRLEEIKPQSTSASPNLDALPEELRALFS